MGRLTYRGNNGKGYVKNQGYYNGVYAQLEIVAERLTAYEEKIPFDRLASTTALVEARDEGRVVVLQGDYTEADGEEALRTAMYHCSVTNNPVTRYTADAIAEKLVRTEAEAALGGGGDG